MNKRYIIGLVLALCLVVGAAIVFSNNSSAPEMTIEEEAQGSASITSETYTIEQVATHNTPEDCWSVINGLVYDLTSYIPEHLGGEEILRACGTDGTTLFSERKTVEGEVIGSGTPHSSRAESQLEQYQIGSL